MLASGTAFETTLIGRLSAHEVEDARFRFRNHTGVFTPQLLQETAKEYLRPGNRTLYVITPGAKAPAEPKQ